MITTLRLALLTALTAAASAQSELSAWPADPFAALAALPVQAPTEQGLVVIVRDKLKAAIEGADVFVVDAARADLATHSFLEQSYGSDRALLLATRHGTRYRTGADGTVVVKAPEKALFVAVHGTDTGMSMAVGDRVVVTVEERKAIYVEVVDATGRPLPDVFVAVRHKRQGSQSVLAERARTDAKGRTHLFTRFDSELEIDACVVTAEPLRRVVPADYFTKDPQLLRLQLPASGSVLVRLVDATGAPWSRTQTATLGMDDPTAFRHDALPIGLPTPDGVLFPHVEVGLPLVARAYMSEFRASLVSYGKGPARADDAAKLDVVFGDDEILLRGRLLGVDGEPVRDRSLFVVASYERGHHGESMATDADARFAVLFDLARRKDAAVRVEIASRPGDQAGPLDVAAVEVRADQRGVVEVGDVRLISAPVHIAGRVLDDADAPVADAAVTYRAEGTDKPLWSTRTERDGRFAVCDLRELGPGSVNARGKNLRIPAVKVRGDERDLVLRQPAVGSLRLSFAGSAPRHLTITTLRLGDQGARIHVCSDPAFITSLEPGTYEVGASIGRHQLFTFLGIVVPARGESADPRLRDIDLRKHVRTVAVNARTRDGSALDRVWGELDCGDRNGPIRFACDERGHVDLPVVPDGKLTLTSMEHRSETLTPRDEPLEVTLRPRARLQFTVPEGMRLPGRLFVRGPVGSWTDLTAGVPYRPDGDGTVTLRFAMRTARGHLEELWQVDVALPDHDRLHEVPLDLDAETLERAHEIQEEVRQQRDR